MSEQSSAAHSAAAQSPLGRLAHRVRDFSIERSQFFVDKYDKFRRLSGTVQTAAMITFVVILAAFSTIPTTRGARFGIHRSTLLHTWNEEHAFAWWERQAPFVVGAQPALSSSSSA